MEANGIIIKVIEPTEQESCMVVAKQKNTGELRTYIDPKDGPLDASKGQKLL